jgi:hypothetical protein
VCTCWAATCLADGDAAVEVVVISGHHMQSEVRSHLPNSGLFMYFTSELVRFNPQSRSEGTLHDYMFAVVHRSSGQQLVSAEIVSPLLLLSPQYLQLFAVTVASLSQVS